MGYECEGKILFAEEFGAPQERRRFFLIATRLGTKGIRVFESRIERMLEATTISEHDAVIARHVATVLCGGDGNSGSASEQHFLDLERDAFLTLLKTKKTQERIDFLLNNNKPLRN